jgi:hypothetical protein
LLAGWGAFNLVEGLIEGLAVSGYGKAWQQDAPAAGFGHDLGPGWAYGDQEVP